LKKISGSAIAVDF